MIHTAIAAAQKGMLCHHKEVIVNVLKLIDKAEEALCYCPVPRSGSWLQSHRRVTPYLGAKFCFEDASWAVCRGHQIPGSARLLDATVAYMKDIGATNGVAILKPPKKSTCNSREPKAEFLRRLQAAAWIGCKVVWITADTAEGSLARTWACDKSFEPDDLDKSDLDKTVAKMRAALEPGPLDWAKLTKSRDAENCIRDVLDNVLSALSYEPTSRSFAACWRKAITDGVWKRESGHPVTLALEVKLKEDMEAPLSQVVDDISQFDAVVCIRVVTPEARQKLQEVARVAPLQEEALRSLQKALPIRYIDIDASGMA